MPKLKSAVNSFLLTKKRFKRRRKTNKRKRTNRRYKRWMRGGAIDKVKYDELLVNVPDKDAVDAGKLNFIETILKNKLADDVDAQKFIEEFDALKVLSVDDLQNQVTAIGQPAANPGAANPGAANPGAANPGGNVSGAEKITVESNGKIKVYARLNPDGTVMAGGGRRRR